MGKVKRDDFNQVYDKTYDDVLKYIICRCKNIHDVNDIIQDTYLEFWRIIQKKDLEDNHIKSYLIQIASNKVKKYYTLISKLQALSLSFQQSENLELMDYIEDAIDIESMVFNQMMNEDIWKQLKSYKNQDIPKIFYLYYQLDMTIKEIAIELDRSESYIKNCIYRTIHELRKTGDCNGK